MAFLRRFTSCVLCLIIAAAAPGTFSLVRAQQPSDLTLSSSSQYPHAGDLVIYTANVSCTGFQPTGSVTFSDGKALNETVPLKDGAAEIWDIPPAGSYVITAAYSGDSNCAAASAKIELIVGSTAEVTLTSSPNPSLPGQAVTFTATVTCGYSTTTTLTFSDNGTPLTTVPITTEDLYAPVVVTYTTSALSVGTHPIEAIFAVDSGGVCKAPDGETPYVYSNFVMQVVGYPTAVMPNCPKAYPNLGAVIISNAQRQYALWAPEKDPATNADGAKISLPIDADKNGFDEYLVLAKQTVNDQLWYGIYVGGCNPVWVPANKVTVSRAVQ